MSKCNSALLGIYLTGDLEVYATVTMVGVGKDKLGFARGKLKCSVVNGVPVSATFGYLGDVTLTEKLKVVKYNGNLAIYLPDSPDAGLAVESFYDTAKGEFDEAYISARLDLNALESLSGVVTQTTPFRKSDGSLSVGDPILFYGAAIPSNAVAMEGQSFDMDAYPVLAKRYPDGVVPDYRDLFVGMVGENEKLGEVVVSQAGPITFKSDPINHSHNFNIGTRYGSNTVTAIGHTTGMMAWTMIFKTNLVSSGTPEGKIKDMGTETRPACTVVQIITLVE